MDIFNYRKYEDATEIVNTIEKNQTYHRNNAKLAGIRPIHV
jgi:hypothetical protein